MTINPTNDVSVFACYFWPLSGYASLQTRRTRWRLKNAGLAVDGLAN